MYSSSSAATKSPKNLVSTVFDAVVFNAVVAVAEVEMEVVTPIWLPLLLLVFELSEIFSDSFVAGALNWSSVCPVESLNRNQPTLLQWNKLEKDIRICDADHSALTMFRLTTVEPDRIRVTDRHCVRKLAMGNGRHEARPEAIHQCRWITLRLWYARIRKWSLSHGMVLSKFKYHKQRVLKKFSEGYEGNQRTWA